MTGDGSGGGIDGGGTDDGGGATETAAESVRFGSFATTSGGFAPLWPANTQSINAALENINGAGGPQGATVEVLGRETVGTQQTRERITQYVNNDEVSCLLGGTSVTIPATYERYAEVQTPLINPWAGTTFLNDKPADNGTPDDLSDDGWVWRTTASDTLAGRGAAVYLANNGFDSVGILVQDTPGAQSYETVFSETYQQMGGTIAERVAFARGKSSYQTELNRLYGSDFDAFLLSAGNEADGITIINNWVGAGYGGQLFVSNGIRTTPVAEAVPEGANGALGASALLQGPAYEQFLDRYQQQGDESLHQFAVGWYDAVTIAALALHAADEFSAAGIQRNLGPVGRSNGTEVTSFAEGKEALDNGEEINYQGAATPCDFDENGEVVTDVGIFELDGNLWNQGSTLRAGDLS
jgi:ABC-type branched-subunit amino acid transport system substrate-binding protein